MHLHGSEGYISVEKFKKELSDRGFSPNGVEAIVDALTEGKKVSVQGFCLNANFVSEVITVAKEWIEINVKEKKKREKLCEDLCRPWRTDLGERNFPPTYRLG
jgi:hypothetical protein